MDGRAGSSSDGASLSAEKGSPSDRKSKRRNQRNFRESREHGGKKAKPKRQRSRSPNFNSDDSARENSDSPEPNELISQPAVPISKSPGAKKNSNFLTAYPTKKVSKKTLQSLLPVDWSATRVADLNNRAKYPLVEIRNVSSPSIQKKFEAFRKVEQPFDCEITRLQKIENPYLWLMFRLTAIYNNEVLKLDSRQVFLYHGTNKVNVRSIALDNFDYRRAGNNLGTRYGAGVNFSAAPVLARRYSMMGHCMVLARVLQGRSTVGNEKTVLPEPGCDSTRNEGDIVVKFHDHEFYPEFLIFYNETEN